MGGFLLWLNKWWWWGRAGRRSRRRVRRRRIVQQVCRQRSCNRCARLGCSQVSQVYTGGRFCTTGRPAAHFQADFVVQSWLKIKVGNVRIFFKWRGSKHSQHRVKVFKNLRNLQHFLRMGLWQRTGRLAAHTIPPPPRLHNSSMTPFGKYPIHHLC